MPMVGTVHLVGLRRSLVRYITNDAGYVGIDYLDSVPFWGYMVVLRDVRGDDKRSFSMIFAYMQNERDRCDVGVEVAWDETVGRYREFSANREVVGFQAEIKNPPKK
jgi:hypothetical protein